MYNIINNKFSKEDIMTWKDYLCNIVITILWFIDGRFGNRVLKQQYRRWWRIMTYGTLIFLFFKFIMFPFMEWWSGVVALLNYIIWG